MAVVGSQSAGKSSVLEALVGRDFLPRGPGICTRCPLLLQLVRAAPGSPDVAEFLHVPGKRYTDFGEVRSEIEAETARRAGPGTALARDAIRLRVASPRVLTMTLVDLPGLAKLPTGDQPADVGAQVRDLCLHYISAPTCVILAVTPAAADAVTSDGLALAREVDPAGERTVGVLTKADLVDAGTSAAPLLRGDALPLRLGYVAVVCRGVAASAAGASAGDGRAAEVAFFGGRPEYAGLAARTGVPALARTLNRVLADAVRASLPSLGAALDDATAARARELAVLGAAPPGSSPAARGALLLRMLESYAGRFAGALDGSSPSLPLDEVAGGARLRHVFRDVFVAGLAALDPAASLSDADVRTALRNAGGVRGTLLIPDAPFEVLARGAVRRLLPPCLAAAQHAHAELLRMAEDALPPDVDRFPALRGALLAAADAYVSAGAAPAERMIRDLVAIELAFINTDHPDFVGGGRAVALAMERRAARAGPPTAAAPRQPPRPTPPASPTKGLATALASSPPAGGALLRGELAGDEAAAPRWAWPRRGGGAAPAAAAPPALPPPPRTLTVPPTASDAEEVQVEVTRTLVGAYHAIVVRNLQDAVPKAIMHFMVNAVSRGLQQHLITELYREERFGELVAERGDVASRRSAALDALDAARRARRVLETLPAQLTAAARGVGGGGGRPRPV